MLPSRRPIAPAVLVLSLALSIACGAERRNQAAARTGGDPGRGRAAIEKYGCAVCHTVPGVEARGAAIGPNLGGIGTRPRLTGGIEHTADNLILYIQDPRQLARHSSMPDVGVTEQDARDIAAYLYAAR